MVRLSNNMMTLYVILYMWMWFSQSYDQLTRLSCRSVVKINCRKCCNWRPSQINAPCLIDATPMRITPKYWEKSKSSKIIQFSHFVALINKGLRITFLFSGQVQGKDRQTMTAQWSWMRILTSKLRSERAMWISGRPRSIKGWTEYFVELIAKTPPIH